MLRLFAVSFLSLAVSQATAQTPCSTYTISQIADAIRNSTSASRTMMDNACMWGGAAKAESGGRSCADNGNNYGVLQLTRANLPPGMTPEEYKHLTLQEQIEIWAKYGGPEQQGAAFNTLTSSIGQSINGVRITPGMVAACSQFGGLICRANLNYIRATGQCQTDSNGGVRATRTTLANGTATLDGNGQSICSWGNVIQSNIDASGCDDSPESQANCGPGDFNIGNGTVASATAPPPPRATDILVADGEV